MHRSINIQNSLPDDIALKIASSLQVFDVCSLGSCSRFWRELCAYDCVWEALCKDRWPAICVDENSQSESSSSSKRWRGLYISKHNEMAGKVASVTNFVERALAYESIEVGNYLKAVELLNSLQFGFKDVQMLLLKPELNVLLNLAGLHYCIIWLEIPAENVIEALHSSQVSERQVCVQWWKLGRWFYGFRLRDEFHSRNVSLGDLAASNEEVLGVLHRGAIHEVIRVQISAAKPTHTSWSHQVAQV
ncbi:hypothetical protein C2S52_014584 [Perilla frutescens var. hirtella]|uniref:F-box domain-containing protein n=1 Tax=Perilla frutescens var. hirtella TaxID=608512 RepID=A0AAD4IP06_PERFH|nr:hypothetical protein C2S53_004276 [Perilla frutescens var. hirtella]KAH6769781.1 hypothetical protein C2S52_014584 [Perilla frutescens var. hirtella]KAH6816571.1 hypothetical protein C2S51_021391 [Perilla frutescens var. frutescens]